jgi:pimeloyl-ACP methyl ester carboxylesterase
VVAVDLPSDDDSAGLAEYVDTVVDAIGPDRDLSAGLVLVAQSMGAFTAPLVCERVPVDLMVLVAAMVPAPGESPGEWWGNTGQEAAQAEQARRDGREPGMDDIEALFLHDVPADLIAQGWDHVTEQSGTPFIKPWPAEAWPDVPTRFLLCRGDRMFPADFQRRIVRERLGIVPDEMDGGHLPAMSHPKELADRLAAYWTDLSKGRR